MHTISCIMENKMVEQLQFEEKRVFFRELDIPEYAFSICSEKELKINEITEITTKILTKY